MKRLGGAILLAAFTVGAALCAGEERRVRKAWLAYEPAAALTENQRYYFYIVGFQKGVARLVRLTELQPDGTHPQVDSFYIPASQAANVRETMPLPGEIRALDTLQIVQDDPVRRRQRISLSLDGDGYQYSPIYDVAAARVTPVSYKDVTRREVFQSTVAGLKLFAPVMVIGLVLAIALPKILDRRKAKSSHVP
jgi:hypothetical protein